MHVCDRPQLAKGLCTLHYGRLASHGDVRADKPPSRRGYSIDKDGYVVLYRPGHPSARKRDGSIREHRLVMSEMLGRPILKDEIVHHRNGIKTDNRPENLELWVKAHGPGQRVDEVVEWAARMLERYAPERLA